MFKVCFCLYALSCIVAPSKPSYVDPRFLLAIRDPNAIGEMDWASFTYNVLIEGISAYQTQADEYAGGCMLFLQLFYLDALVCGGGNIFHMGSYPITTWGPKQIQHAFREIEEQGGLYSNNRFVSKRHSVRNPFSGSRDVSTGLKTSLVDDLALVKTHVRCMKKDFTTLKDNAGAIEPRIVELCGATVSVVEVVGMFTENGIKALAAAVYEKVVEIIDFEREPHNNDSMANQGTAGVILDDVNAGKLEYDKNLNMPLPYYKIA